ncbi:MAG: ABC transporter ATP-binding protein [Dehalococcoidia bacterium]|nr:ABC transporter ATP-binding protein [Dehalococcoidia bacterium]
MAQKSSFEELRRPDLSFAIQTLNLNKIFGGLVAVDNLNLDVRQGELFALLGPNGAGKTTALSMICCLMKPSGGSAFVMGHDITIAPYEVKKLIGVVPQETTLSPRLNPLENLELVAAMHGLSSNKAKKWSKLMLETIGLESRAKDQVRKFSGGMKRRLSIAMALIHDPQVVVLDEPTLGLDPQSRRNIWEYIGRLKGEKTILLTTHYMEEADSLADRIGIIDSGKIVALGTPAELKTSGLDVRTIVVKGWNITQNAILHLQDHYQDVKIEGGTILITDKDLDFNILVSQLQTYGVSPRAVYFREPTLEDVFIRTTGKELRE